MKLGKAIILTLAMVVSASSADARSYRMHYAGSHHSVSHGGHYYGGSGSSHRGGHYSNYRTGGRYGCHRC